MRTESWTITEPRAVTTELLAYGLQPQEPGDELTLPDPVTTVVVAVNAGSVRVVAHEHLDVRTEVLAISARPLVVGLAGEEVRVSYDFTGIDGVVDRIRGLRDKDSVDVVLHVPPTVAVRVSTVRASVHVSGVEGAVTVSTVDGPVVLDGVSGAATVQTVSGAAEVSRHRGPVNVRTGTGAIGISGRPTRADVSTVSGVVALTTEPGACVITTKTVSSDIVLRAPEGTRVDLHARSVSGKIVLDGVDLRARGSRPASVEHAEPDATTFLSTSTVSGDVIVSRG